MWKYKEIGGKVEIQVRRLDEVYEISEKTNHSIQNSADKISSDLIRFLNNMNEHWKGSDASLLIKMWLPIKISIKKIISFYWYFSFFLL